MTSLKILSQLILLLSLALVVCGSVTAQQKSANQLDIQLLLREVEAKGKENTPKLLRYSYTLKRTTQELNDKGEVKKEKIYVYQVFPLRQGLPAMLLLSEDGKASQPEKLAKEKIKVNKYWQEQKNELRKSKNSDAARWFEGLDFSIVGNERYEGREVGLEPQAH